MQDIFKLEKAALGIELGSTRIKGVLIGPDHAKIASGDFTWENKFEDGNWTFDMEDVWTGLQYVFSELSKEVQEKYGVPLTKVGSIGFSGMMHGYLPFDKEGKQLAAFRTWRNTTTEKAAEVLTELLKFNIPQRWSMAHLYQAILNNENHVGDIDFLTTLAGYVHWKLTGEKVLGVGDASGMFPIDSNTVDYDSGIVKQFDELLAENGLRRGVRDIFPKVLSAGDAAGLLTEAGARLLDPSGTLQAGIPFCAPEGDAGTGMVATNSITEHTGNVSAGTSIFAMIVLEKALSDYYVEIDIVTTPTGKPVAMVHCNNFTSDINAWVALFKEITESLGVQVDMGHLFTTLFKKALEADTDVGGLVNCNYFSGEPITRLEEGRPLMVRMPDSKLSLSNFMRSQIYSALATLKIGMDILTEKERVQIDNILGHGGFFKTEKVGQQLMADAIKVPVSVMSTAGEGGPWGMALLAIYSINKRNGQTLEDYLANYVFASAEIETVEATQEGIASFTNYMERYDAVLKVERTAIDYLK